MAQHILCIETATEVCSVAIARDGQCLLSRSLTEEFRHSSRLTPLIQEVLDSCDLAPSDLSAVSISDGPGSYTGLRVGSSTAKAICYSQDIPLIAISTLQSIAYGFKINHQPPQDHIIMPTIDARRMEVYTTFYDHQLNQLASVSNVIYDNDYLSMLSKTYNNKTIVICGHGSNKLQTSSLTIPTHITIYPTYCDAKNLCALSAHLYQSKTFVETSSHTPYYHKAPKITVPKSKIL